MNKINRKTLVIIAVLLLALCLRIWGVSYDLPYIYHPDEPTYVFISQTMFKNLSPHTSFFNYPSLFFYINAGAYVPYYLTGMVTGSLSSPANIQVPDIIEMGVTKSPSPGVILLGRMLTVLFGTAAALMIFLAGKKLTGSNAAGVLAAAAMAVCPANVTHSRFITPDIFVVFFASATLLAAVSVYQKGKTGHYIIAGLCAGFTASCKYNGGLILSVVLVAHILRHGKQSLKAGKIYLALLFTGIGFFGTSPYILLNHQEFLSDLQFEAEHYAGGHSGMEGNSLEWYLSFMWQTAGIIYLLAVMEILRGVFTGSKKVILLSAFPVLYFAFISTFIVRNDRTFLPLTPFLFLLAGSFIVFLFHRARALKSDRLRRTSAAAVILLAAAAIAQPLIRTTSETLYLSEIKDDREAARIWIAGNLPPGSAVALESYSPYLEPDSFQVQGIQRMIDNPPAWYVENGFSYLVFSEKMYGRFYADPERYAEEISQYEILFNSFSLDTLFSNETWDIRVCSI